MMRTSIDDLLTYLYAQVLNNQCSRTQEITRMQDLIQNEINNHIAQLRIHMDQRESWRKQISNKVNFIFKEQQNSFTIEREILKKPQEDTCNSTTEVSNMENLLVNSSSEQKNKIKFVTHKVGTEIQIKNNKNVFIYEQKNFNIPHLYNREENQETLVNFIKRKKYKKIIGLNFSNKNSKTKRCSQYRGVSRNGNQWQVMIMIRKRKYYLGTFQTELEAAKHYDVISVKNNGIKAKTNFFYTDKEIEKILAQEE
jgi:hypothetical protein